MWVNKYIPSDLSSIILNKENKKIFETMMEKKYFPNLLFYGPPGTGKTTTIIQLIRTYQEKFSIINKNSVIHLNASDERNIEVIQNEIYSFVKSSTLFHEGFKFVILDEVDYMTSEAQLTLKKVIDGYQINVRYCIICNYLNKIDKSLQNHFVHIHFQNLPTPIIHSHLKNIADKEKIPFTDEQFYKIQSFYKNDIRSMIHFLNSQSLFPIIDDEIWNHALQFIDEKDDISDMERYINEILFIHNLSLEEGMILFCNYLFINHVYSYFFVCQIEKIIHNDKINKRISLSYFLCLLKEEMNKK
jgi:replication factor C subunit 3/5